MTKHTDLGLKTSVLYKLEYFAELLKGGASNVKMTKRGDLGQKTLFCTLYKLVHFPENR